MRFRDRIKSYADYANMLHAIGYSKKEVKILAKPWHQLPCNDGKKVRSVVDYYSVNKGISEEFKQ